MDSLKESRDQMLADSRFWFDPTLIDNAPYMALALCGEVGEVANILKKMMRGDVPADDVDAHNAIAWEIVDCFIYLQLLAAACKVDIGKAYDSKRQFNVERWGDPDKTLKSV